MKITKSLQKESKIYNKVNHKNYLVISNDGTTVVAQELLSEEAINPDGEQVVITEENAICYRVKKYARDINVPVGYTVENGVLLDSNGDPVAEQGQIKIKKILGAIEGYLILGLESEKEDEITLATYEVARDKFVKSSTVPDQLKCYEEHSSAKKAVFTLNTTKVIKNDKDEEKEVCDQAILIIVYRGFINTIKNNSPWDDVIAKDDTEVLFVSSTKNHLLESKPAAWYRVDDNYEDMIDTVSLDLIKVTDSEYGEVYIGSDEFCVEAYEEHIPYEGKKLFDTPILVDVTNKDAVTTYSFASKDATKVTTIKVKKTSDRGFVVQ